MLNVPAENLIRTINSRFSVRQIPDLLQSIFLAELLVPSKVFWLVSPWISDIPVLDNSSGGFASIEPDWPLTTIPITKVLERLVQGGTSVHVAMRDVQHNQPVGRSLEAIKLTGGAKLKIHYEQELHEKGMLGTGYWLSGSMNFTFNGISFNNETVTFCVEPGTVARQAIAFTTAWGGEIP